MAGLSFFFAFRLQPKLPEEDIAVIFEQYTLFFYHTLNFLEYKNLAGELGRQNVLAIARETVRGTDPATKFKDAMFNWLRDFSIARTDPPSPYGLCRDARAGSVLPTSLFVRKRICPEGREPFQQPSVFFPSDFTSWPTFNTFPP